MYKRNLKPNPTVQLVEDEENSMETNLYIAPILIRCDTLEEKSKLMTGNKPVKVAPGRVVSFRRLKITSTSHQQGESLFAIKFELRRYHGNEYEILDFVQSNPICVLSHSTQLRPGNCLYFFFSAFPSLLIYFFKSLRSIFYNSQRYRGHPVQWLHSRRHTCCCTWQQLRRQSFSPRPF